MKLDSAILDSLGLDASKTHVSSSGGGGCSSASTSKITTTMPNGQQKRFFLKTGTGKEAETMFAGEHLSLKSIHDVVPTLCPLSHGHGICADTSDTHFLVTDFLDLSSRSGPSIPSTNHKAPQSLAQKLAKLHSTPAPTPKGFSNPQFGFPVPTCCGDTPQRNDYRASWADFYAENRLLFILERAERAQGKDTALRDLVEKTAYVVVPRLLGDEHLNDGLGIVPVVCHGDLWSGNKSFGRLPGMEEVEEVTYDSSAVYGHSEYEIGAMRMFGGFGRGFWEEYHGVLPKTEPVGEYEDRCVLYELFHQLNHYAMFGGGYKGGAVRMMKQLMGKYGG